jgi:hypothetical protein
MDLMPEECVAQDGGTVMSPSIDPTYAPRLWRCEECRAVLGVVLRDSDRVRRLWVFRIQVRDAASVPTNEEMIDSAGSVEHAGLQSRWRVRAMDSGIVGCDFCESLQEWHISDEAMLDLIRQVQGEDGVTEYKRLSKDMA